MENTLTVSETKTITISEGEMLIAISSDTLIVMKTETETEYWLLDGKDIDACLLLGKLDTILDIIKRCLNARKTNTTFSFEVDKKIINFR